MGGPREGGSVVSPSPSPKKREKYEFRKPPECPVFRPTLEEFQDPLNYIRSIRSVGENSGICKIIPPSSWKPPFAINFDDFKFTPRIQRINELEAETRVRLNFLDQIAKFWALQGKPLQIPMYGKQMLDLYALHKAVLEEGGPEEVNKKKKWCSIATKIGVNYKTVTVRNHYVQLIYPFFLFQKEHSKVIESCEEGSMKEEIKLEPKSENSTSEEPSEDLVSPSVSPLKVEPLRLTNIRELKSLQFLGPGPKMAVCNFNMVSKARSRTRGKRVLYNFDPLSKFVCKSCCNEEEEGQPLVKCDKCDDKYHKSCIVPPIKGDSPSSWKCPKCVAIEVCKPAEEFGFAQAQREYSLKEFGEMANDFKKKYFASFRDSSVPFDVVENEFWRVMSSIEESVTVEYGADLHTVDVGSGFPTKENFELPGVKRSEVVKYVRDKWNLNNLAVLDRSALRHICADISGMKIPWVYVGMCFATFCWHIEDHWSYSINYMHWGEAKTWYGVPGHKAEEFEEAMRCVAPELFQHQPDLLHHLVTIMNPNTLMNLGIPICRADQNAGEFIVTFPRAYHSGFNQGFNFAEACNFAPSDWLKIGRDCILHYSSLKRYPVFSHDELICKMVDIQEELDEETRLATFKDFCWMMRKEQERREFLLNVGVTEAEKEEFENLQDDERQCDYCRTTCFLSALYCSCDSSKIVCLDHFDKLCSCPMSKLVLKYRFRIDELWDTFGRFRDKAFNMDEWAEKSNAIYTNREEKHDLAYVTELLDEAKEKEYPRSEVFDYLDYSIKQCLEYSSVAKEILHRVSSGKIAQPSNKPTLDEVTQFLEEMQELPFILDEIPSIKFLIDKGKKFKKEASTLLTKTIEDDVEDFNGVKKFLESGRSLNIDLEELPAIEAISGIMIWIKKCSDYLMGQGEKGLMPGVRLLKSLHSVNGQLSQATQTGKHFPFLSLKVQALLESRDILFCRVEETITSLKKQPGHSTNKFAVERVNEAEDVLSSHYSALGRPVPRKDVITTSSENKIKKILSGKLIVGLECLTDLAQTGENSEFGEEVNKVKRWYQEAKKLFCSRTSDSLLDLLWPRVFNSRKILFRNRTKDVCFGKTTDMHFLSVDYIEAKCEELTSLFKVRIGIESAVRDNPEVCEMCICEETKDEAVFTCYLCKTPFHQSCIPTLISKASLEFGLPPKILCGFCRRSKRPALRQVLQLMEDAKQLKIQIPETTVLDKMVQHIKLWVSSVRKILDTEGVKKAIRLIFDKSESLRSRPDNKLAWARVYRGVKIPEESFLKLKQWSTEGDLIEVTVPEVSQIWILTEANKMELGFRYEEDTPIELRGPSSPLSVASSAGDEDKKSLKRRSTLTTQPFVRKKRRMRRRTIQITGKNSTEEVEEILEEDEEKCAAESCLDPDEEDIDWIQCDGKCGSWFHMKCVDLVAGDITKEDEYICKKCLNPPQEEEEIPIEDLTQDFEDASAEDPLQ